jgi:hypothetical protein
MRRQAPARPAGETINGREARLIALAAQGFGQPQPGASSTTADILAMVKRLGALQLDSVNVFCRSHYMPIYSRLGTYDRAELDRLAARRHVELA